MFRRFARETGRLCRTKLTWLLAAVTALLPILAATDFLVLGSRVYDTTISNVLMLKPARLSLYISAFFLMVFTLLQLKQLYTGGAYTIVESAANPVAQILLQTIAVCAIVVASVCAALLVLCPYTAIMMKELFSFAKFIRTWIYVYLLGLLITVLLTSGVFLVFRNFEVSLVLMSALMLFSISRPVESNYLTHWLQTSVTSLADGTESTLRFKVMLYTRLIGVLMGVGVYALGLLCVRRYAKGILGSAVRNMRYAAIPLLLVVSIATSAFCVKNDPLYWQDKNNINKLTEYVVNTETQTIEVDDSSDSEFYERLHDNEEQYNLSIQWKEMNAETIVESDHLEGKLTYEIINVSSDKEQVLTIRTSRGIEPTKILCNGESLDLSVGNFNFADYYYYHFTLPAGVDNATIEILFQGFPKGSTDYTELSYPITEQYVELSDQFPELMTKGSDIKNYTFSLPKDLTLLLTGIEVKEVAPALEGYRTYTYSLNRKDALLYYSMFAGDYVKETAQVGDLQIQFLYFRNKDKIMQEIGAMEIIEDVASYFTNLYGPLDFGGKPLIVAETERDYGATWQQKNLCGIAESAIVSSLYQADRASPDVARSAGLQSLVTAIAKLWWNRFGVGASTDYSLQGAFTNYSTYLYMKHLYGEAYAREALVEPWYKMAKEEQNEFYRWNKQYITVMPLKDAVEIYYPYTFSATSYLNTGALFHAEELVGEEKLTKILVGAYDEFKGGEGAYFKTFQYLSYDMFLERLGITQEEFETW